MFQVVLTFGNVPRQEVPLPGLKLTRLPYSYERAAPQLDLTFNVFESAAGLRGSVDYASDLFGTRPPVGGATEPGGAAGGPHGPDLA